MLLVLFLRVVWLYWHLGAAATDSGRRRTLHRPLRLLIVVGLGGHGSEMNLLLRQLTQHRQFQENACEKIFVAAEGENTHPALGPVAFRIRRSRHVHQSFLSSIPSTVLAIYQCTCIIRKCTPDLVLCNGPGTCFPVFVAAWVCNVLSLPLVSPPIKMVYVESIARVTSLSLTGHLLYHFVDGIVSMWPELPRKYPKCRYFGRLI